MAVTLHDRKYYLSDTVSIAKLSLQKPTPPHLHDFIEIVYMLRGKCTHTIDGVAHLVSRGHMLIVNYNQTHSISGDPDAEFFNIYLKPAFIDSSLTQEENAFSLLRLSKFEDFRQIVNERNAVFSFAGEERSAIESLIAALHDELRDKPAGWQLAVESGFNMLLIHIFRKMSLPLFPAEKSISGELLTYIKRHCHEPLTLKALSARYFYNPSYFSRLFKQYTGQTLTAYIKSARMEQAAELLRETEHTVTDIYQAVGYHDKTKFFRDFKQTYGISPMTYRRANDIRPDP